MYDYREAMRSDIRDYIRNEISLSDYTDREDLETMVYDELFTADSVTGNGSGSYTFNRFQAMENVLDNMDDLLEACKEFCVDNAEIGERFVNEDWEYFDVTIRCYLLSECLCNVLDEMEENGELNFESEE